MEILEYKIGDGAIAFSTKRGTPDGNYGSFNITHYCGDAAEHVAACRKELCKQLEIPDERLILPRQTHGSEIIHIDNVFLSKSKEEQEALLQGIDAIITALPRTCIGVSTADCVPILLHAPAQGVIAAVHAGWRGTVAGITEKSVKAMLQGYNSHAEELKAIIAPSIGPEAFEVGEEVYTAFKTAGFPMEQITIKKEKWHIDLWEANRLQLLACGVKPENITVTGICTHSNHEEFFSARRLGINSGRIFNGIMLK